MRIISGTYKNRKINFKKLKSRPTTDFAKESLFNLLNNHYDLSSIYVLDLFSGSGNISYEFISRGCQHITAIDNNVKCIEFMKKIKAELQMKNLNIKLKNINYYIKKIESTYDIIFADPPYHYVQAHYMNIIENIRKSTKAYEDLREIDENPCFLCKSNRSLRKGKWRRTSSKIC